MTNVSITAVQSRKSRKDIILDKLFDGYLTLDTKEMEKEVLSWKGKVSWDEYIFEAPVSQIGTFFICVDGI